MKIIRILCALALALPLSTATARPAAQGGSTDYDGNGVTDARDLVAFVGQWVIDSGLSVAPTSTALPSATNTAPASATLTRTPTPQAPSATSTPTPQTVTAQRMVVVVLENRNLADVQANQYFASLAARGRLLTNYLAIANPSQPNYVALNFGDTMGVVDNSLVDIPGRNIVDLLEERGISWRTYHEAYPGGCYAGYYPSGNTLYARKHNAFISADSVRNNAARCAKIRDGLAFDADVASGTLPRYSLYVPDENNSSHDTSIDYAANWLQAWLGPKLNNPTLQDVLWVITWDEGEVNGPVPISTILIGPGISPGTTDATQYTHYSLLRTTQVFFGLGTLGRNDETAPVIPLAGGALPTPSATSPPATPTPTLAPSATRTATRTATFLPVITNTATRTATPTATRTATPTRTPGGTPMAFGDVSVIDAFTRADGGLGSGWTTDAASDGAAAPRIVSNQVACVSGGGYSSAYYNLATYSGNKQAYMSVPTLPESPRYFGLGFIIGPGASVDGYHVEYRVGTGILIYRIDNTIFTQLGAAISWTPSNGHKLGIRIDETNGVIEAWTHNGTSWTQAGTRSDSTYTGAAYPELYIRGTNTRVDDFAAGSESAPVSVSPSAATAVGASVAPAVVQSSIVVAPAVSTAVAASVAPTVVLGSVSTTPSASSAVAASVAPTAILGSVIVAPAADTSVAATVAPTVVLGSVTIAPAADSAVATTVAPTVILGSINTTPGATTSVAATVAPTVVLGNVSVTPAVVSAVATTVAPTVVGGSITVAPAAASAVAATVAPSVQAGGNVSVSPAAASAVATVVAPTVVLGSVVAAPANASAVVATVAPSVVLGNVATTPASASAVIASVSPAVVLGSAVVAPAPASAVAVSVAPGVVLGNVAIAPPASSAVTATAAPAVVLGSVSTTPAPAYAVAVTVNPSIGLPSVAVSPAPASAVALSVAPSVNDSGIFYTPAPAWLIIEARQPQIIAPIGMDIAHPGRTVPSGHPGTAVRAHVGAAVGVRNSSRNTRAR